MLALGGKLFVVSASYASILSLFLSSASKVGLAWWQWVLLAASFLFFIIIVGWEIWQHFREAPKRYRNSADIKKYMCRWVKSGGQTVILSRDMSWVDDTDTMSSLMTKAAAKELTVFLKGHTGVADKLGAAGANVIDYTDLGYTPRSRFTIIDYGRDGSRVAIGVNNNGAHTIQEFRSGVHPLYAVAEDLVKFLHGHYEAKT